jgi:hypothetical protein
MMGYNKVAAPVYSFINRTPGNIQAKKGCINLLFRVPCNQPRIVIILLESKRCKALEKS